MRKIIELQLELGQTPISEIKINLKSRDELPKILIGLQALFCDQESRTKIFALLKDLIPPNINSKNGREGMHLWRILVLGMTRLGCNWNYDKLLDIANNHKTLRLMLCHGGLSDEYEYKLQTLKDNVSRFTPEILDQVNNIAVEYGHDFFFRIRIPKN
jgi:hypothetical protein